MMTDSILKWASSIGSIPNTGGLTATGPSGTDYLILAGLRYDGVVWAKLRIGDGEPVSYGSINYAKAAADEHARQALVNSG